ncbi:hypothetical protein BDP27DRAFT_1424424 [Rhodocollybia butyracea]|uniref:Uncharacterized protein n=1 Tax=Rhodocollybia butyracea TaxID=206335 RepID=A0A9P5PPK3_9AGAR|nr:hypothetical protein BDP27DRAFT_1424424 [Rhodocollybia butyracea]
MGTKRAFYAERISPINSVPEVLFHVNFKATSSSTTFEITSRSTAKYAGYGTNSCWSSTPVPGEYVTYFLGPADSHAAAYHYKRLRLAKHHDPISGVSEPDDALPELVQSKQEETSEGDNSGDEEGGSDGTSSGSEEEQDSPVVFKALFEEAEAQGTELSGEMGDLVGSYHPDRKRIAETAAEYLERNPAVGLRPDSVLSYPGFRIS